jgi:hypothetical protein
MTETEIIEGLLLYLGDKDINVMKAVDRIGYKKYKIFEKAMEEALILTQ